MNETDRYYQHYKKIRTAIKGDLEHNAEYRALHEQYPHITKTILLNMKKKKTKQRIKTLKGGAQLREKRKILEIQSRLVVEKILKRIHGENKQEIRYKIRLKLDNSREEILKCKMIVITNFSNRYSSLKVLKRGFNRVIHKTICGRIHPVLFNLGSRNVIENNLVLREWVKKK